MGSRPARMSGFSLYGLSLHELGDIVVTQYNDYNILRQDPFVNGGAGKLVDDFGMFIGEQKTKNPAGGGIFLLKFNIFFLLP